MPYKHTGKLIPNKLKRSAKLTAEQKEEIQHRYLIVGGVSQRNLAEEYGVSRRLIQFCIYPEKLAANYARRVERGGSKMYYNKDKHTVSTRKHRRYKQELYLDKKLEEKVD